MGSTTRRSDIHVRLDGHRATTNIDLACAVHRRDRLDHQVVVEHIGLDTVSRQLVHGIATGSSELTFNGRIHIHPGAQRSDARLTNRNLLLDKKARINTKPELEIYANDVKCSHGATVGQIDPAQMFYLRTRGLDEVAARAMLTRAFLAGRMTQWMLDAGVLGIYSELFAS
jgi:Fe-S cluster assembly protein SufD